MICHLCNDLRGLFMILYAKWLILTLYYSKEVMMTSLNDSKHINLYLTYVCKPNNQIKLAFL